MKRKFYFLLTVLLGTYATAAMADDVVYNATKQTGYETLAAALADLDTDATENVLELNGDVTLDGRTGPAEGKTLTLKPTKDGITLHRGSSLKGNSIWFLTNKSSQTLNIGCDDYQLIIDGENKTDNTNTVLGCENGTMNITNVKFANFNYGESGCLNSFKNNSGIKLTLKNVTVENSTTQTKFFDCWKADKLILDGSLNFINCTGTHINVSARLKLINGETFTTTTPITLKISNLSAGNLIVNTNSKDAATANASRFIDVDNNFIFVPSTASSHYHEILLAKGYTLKVSSAKAATFVLPYESTIPDGIKAYTLTYTSGDKAQATEVTETLPANTPVLINAEEGYYQFKATDATAETATNPQSGCLVGAFEETKVPEEAYVLQNQNGNVGFYKVTSSDISIKANQAYLVISSSEAKPASIGIDFDSATAIQGVEEANAEHDNAIYNLSGMRVSKENLTKGQLYITKGKTFIAR